jgi:hypothetical protein
VPLVIAALLVLGVVGVQQGWFSKNRTNGASTLPTVMATEQTATPTPSATPSSSPSVKTSPAQTSTAPQRALKDCRAKVQAADQTLKAAKVGVGHWSAHVQGQTDANAGKITVSEMDAIFKKTRLAGAGDVRQYKDASTAYDGLSGSCDAVDRAPAVISRELSRCAERSKAQKPVLSAAKAAMLDWESHLAAMMRSRMGHVHDAQGVWIRAWRAAPPHIEAYHQAVSQFEAPKC